MSKLYRILCNSLLSIVLISLLYACNNQAKQNKIEKDFDDDSALVDELPDVKKENYKIPTPLELFLFLYDSEADYLSDFMHNPLKYTEYYDSYSRALNFGVYTADLAYATVNGNNQDAILYFKSAKELASVLGLNEGYGVNIANRVDDNLQNVDSLINIAADSYEFSILFLEEQGLTDMLCLIITGGWIESLYLTTHSIVNYDLDNPIIERLVDQQMLLDNLLLYLNNYKESANVSRVIVQLNELQEVYDALYNNADDTLITQTQLVNISNKVSEIRDGFISIN